MRINSYGDKQSIGDTIYNNIRDRILRCELFPGQQLSEKMVSEELGVSRTPVREAFIKLTGENLLEARPYIGTFVSYIDLDKGKEACFIRENLEQAIVALACTLDIKEYAAYAYANIEEQKVARSAGDIAKFIELDNALHRNLYITCDKQMTWELVSSVNSQYDRLRFLSLTLKKDKFSLIEEHISIIKAIEEKNEVLAKQYMNQHLIHLNSEVAAIRNQYPDYFIKE